MFHDSGFKHQALLTIRRLFSRYEIVPVGWGYMAIHTDVRHGVSVITDGGAIPACFRRAIATAASSLDCSLFYPEEWAWIVSHLDYDHISITLRLVERDIISRPRLVILPKVYSQDWCQIAWAKVHVCARLALQHILRDEIYRLRTPRYANLLRVFSSVLLNARAIGASTGTRLRLGEGEVEYILIWPDEDVAARICRKVAEELAERMQRLCRYSTICYEDAEREVSNILRSIKPLFMVEDTETLDLGTSAEWKTRESTFSRRYYRLEHLEAVESSPEQAGYNPLEVLTRAAEKLRDDDFLCVIKEFINATLLAYVLRLRHVEHSHVIVTISSSTIEATCYSPNIVLYLGDLTGGALDRAIRNCLRLVGSEVVVEVVPHHGQEYTPMLNLVRPYISYIPRCDEHRRRTWTINEQYVQSTRDRATYTSSSQHSTHLIILIIGY